ncbi:MAG: transketolase [Rickettsiales bacterium]|nr:transketolase [Rickettsiales bacterium]
MTKSNDIRKDIVNMCYKAKTSHIGSALSCVEILETLYFNVANITKENVNNPARDRVILSKGHACACLYATLFEKGIISKETLDLYAVDNGQLPIHLDMTSADGIDVSSGSLGHGLPLAVGIDTANKLNGINSKIYVVAGDGEMQEGSMWEAIEYISSRKLKDITLIVDYNNFQGSDPTKNITNELSIAKRFESFDIDVFEVDGHNVEELTKVLKKETKNPKVVVAKTLKGKGLSFMENTLKSHYMKITDDLYKQAMEELNKGDK